MPDEMWALKLSFKAHVVYMPRLHNYIKSFDTATLHNTSNHSCHDSPHNFCWHPSTYVYVAEVASSGVNTMRGTMAWLWNLGVLLPMQFFHTLLLFRLLSGHLAHLAVMGHSRMCCCHCWPE